MATYGGAVDLILTELGRGDTSITAVIEREVLKSIESYSSTRFWFNEARSSFTASSTIYYPLETIFPATASFMPGFIEIDQVSTTVNGGVIEILRESHAELHRVDISGFTGYPTRWALFAEQMRLYPKPASTYQVDVLGVRRLATLSASTDSNAWTNAGLDLISARAEKVISARKFKDFEAAQVYQVAEDQALARLISRSESYGMTGRVSPGY